VIGKFLIDKQTKYGADDETDEQRIERIKKRIAWNLELEQIDKIFFKFYNQKKAEEELNQKNLAREKSEKLVKPEYASKPKNAAKPKTKKKLECKPIKDFYLLSDNEINKKLHEIIEPIYPIINEARKIYKEWDSKKRWLEDDEKFAINSVLRIAEDDFPFSYDEYDEIIGGYLIYEDDNDKPYKSDYPYKIDDFLNEVDGFLTCYYEEYSYGIDHYDQKSDFIYDIKFELVRILWSAFNIDEDLIKVKDFWMEQNEKRNFTYPERHLTEDQEEQLKVYEKAFFFGEKERVRAAKIFKQFNKERLAKTNNEEPIREEVITTNKESGFLYFIRNKDIYKIGITQNMLQRMDQLKPDELLDSVRCSNYKELEREIHNKFKGSRIPQTEYFRLDKEEINEIHQILKDKAL